jgi:hypothetical protein
MQATAKSPTGANGIPPGASAARLGEAAPPMGEAAPPFRKAPPGFLYVLRRTSKTTKFGVIGVLPGARLALLERGPAKTKLTDGRTDFEIDNEDLTDDTEAADIARNADEQLQAELAAWQQRTSSMLSPGQASSAPAPLIDPKAQADLGLAPAKTDASRSPAESGLQGSALDRPAYNQRLSLPYWYRYDPWGHRYYIDPYGRWVYY